MRVPKEFSDKPLAHKRSKAESTTLYRLQKHFERSGILFSVQEISECKLVPKLRQMFLDGGPISRNLITIM